MGDPHSAWEQQVVHDAAFALGQGDSLPVIKESHPRGVAKAHFEALPREGELLPRRQFTVDLSLPVHPGFAPARLGHDEGQVALGLVFQGEWSLQSWR